MVEVSLNSLQTFLNTQNISSRLIEKTAEIPLDRLVLTLGTDEKNRPQNLDLYVVEKELASLTPDKKGGKAIFLHLRHVLPFTLQDQAIAEMARYMLFINKGLEYEGFGMSEVDRIVYFRHDLHCSLRQVSDEVLMGLLGYILLIIDAFGPKLEKIAHLQKTFVETVNETLELKDAR